MMLPDFLKTSHLTKYGIRALIDELEKITSKCDQVEIPLKHYFSKDVYAREIFIPKGTFIVGAIHRYQNLNMLSQGEASVLSIDGSVKLKAPHTMVASPGVKRVIYAHEDCVWTTIHGTNEKDIQKIEKEFIVESYTDLNEEG